MNRKDQKLVLCEGVIGQESLLKDRPGNDPKLFPVNFMDSNGHLDVVMLINPDGDLGAIDAEEYDIDLVYSSEPFGEGTAHLALSLFKGTIFELKQRIEKFGIEYRRGLYNKAGKYMWVVFKNDVATTEMPITIWLEPTKN